MSNRISIASLIPFDPDTKNDSGIARLEMFSYMKNLDIDLYYIGKDNDCENQYSLSPFKVGFNFIWTFYIPKAIWCFYKLNKNKKYQLLWATMPSVGATIFAVIFKKIFNLKLIIDARDPLIAGVAIEKGKNSFYYKTIQILEAYIYKNADIICTVTPELKNYISEVYHLENKRIEIIQNATNFKKKNNIKISRPVKIFYAGIFAKYQIIPKLIQNVHRYYKSQKFRFELYGYDEIKDPELKNMIIKFKLQNIIHLHKSISRKNVFKNLEESHFALVPIYGFDLQKDLDYAIPLKFYEALSVSKPVISFGGTKSLNNIINSNHIGVICNINENIFDKLKFLIDKYQYFVNNCEDVIFSRQKESQKLLKIINKEL